MKKITKFMSVLLSLVLTLSVFAMSASAYDDIEYVGYTEIMIDTDIAGVDVDDYYDYITILSPELQFEDDYGEPAVYVEDSDGEYLDGEFEEGETYRISVYLSCNEGYGIDKEDGTEEIEFYALVNGVEPYYCQVDWWNPYDDEDDFHAAIVVEYVQLDFYITVGEDFGYEVIDTIDIDIDIQPGTIIGDYYDYITINTENLCYDDEFGYQTVYAYYDYDFEDPLAVDDVFEAGIYDIDLFFGAAEGYYISNYADVYINGEYFDGYRFATFAWDVDGEYEYSYVCIELSDYEVGEAAEEEFSFWQMIVDFFANITSIFNAIAEFFSLIFG